MKGKPSWAITNYPLDIKIKLWEAMRLGASYPGTQKYISRHPDLFSNAEYAVFGVDPKALASKDDKEIKWTLFSRDTYKYLLNEIKLMPLREVARLPEGVQIWARGMKGDESLSEDIKSILEKQKEHRDDLAKAAFRLAENLKPYLYKDEGYLLRDYVIGTKMDDDIDLEEQLIADIPTRWLLKHLAEDFPFLKTVKSWGEIPTKNITDELLQTMRDKAARRDFTGKCEICEKRL